jgi:outer membrane protein TolC
LTVIKSTLVPIATKNVETAKKSLEAGLSDSLKVLETERSHRTTQLDALEAELSLWKAWVELEKAVGYPLSLFPGEASHMLPAIGLERETKK